MNSKKAYIAIILLALSLIASLLMQAFSVQAEEHGEGKVVYVIPVEKEVERGMEAFISRATEEAIEANADHIIFEIDTPGGRVDAAGGIAEVLQDLNIETTSFITNRALSAGSYIALNTDNIFLKPQATIGASGVINSDGTAADKKAQSAWIAAMKSAAESKGRDPVYAAAMADPSIDLEELGAPSGEFLTLEPSAAVEIGYAEAVVNHRTELLAKLKLQKAEIIEVQTTLAEELARFLTNPVVVPILLSLASVGLIVELYSPGFGIPGSIGLLSLVLFFYGHVVAGLAGYEAIILLVVGMVMIILELFVPGGIIGILGVGAVIGSLFMSAQDMSHMAMSIGVALIASIVVSIILFKTLGMEKGLFKNIILKESTSTEKGYVSSVSRSDLIGVEGVALTALRPSGTADFEGEHLDVVTEGRFIYKDTPVRVVKTEGSRIVVREIKNNIQGE